MSKPATEKDAKPKATTLTVPAVDAPGNSEEIARLQADLAEAQRDLANTQRELTAARNRKAEPIEIELETGAPAWVRRVSGMDASEIKGWVVLPGTNVLVIEDKAGATGHRFTFLPSQRDA